jgi:hypothetical protein
MSGQETSSVLLLVETQSIRTECPCFPSNNAAAWPDFQCEWSSPAPDSSAVQVLRARRSCWPCWLAGGLGRIQCCRIAQCRDRRRPAVSIRRYRFVVLWQHGREPREPNLPREPAPQGNDSSARTRKCAIIHTERYDRRSEGPKRSANPGMLTTATRRTVISRSYRNHSSDCSGRALWQITALPLLSETP